MLNKWKVKKNKNKALLFIALIPPEPLKGSITELKLTFSHKYKCRHALNCPPHITLVPPFRANDIETEQVICLLEELVNAESEFDLLIKGYGAFKPRVIYLEVVENDSADSLRMSLLSKITSSSSSNNKFHITLASRDLDVTMFAEAWNTCKNLSFNGSFLVDRLYLLKHDGKKWEIEREFQFKVRSSSVRKAN